MSAPTPIDLYGTASDTLIINLAFTRADANNVQQPVDLTGATVWLTIKRRLSDPDPGVAQVSTSGGGLVVTDAAAGKATATIEDTATASLDTPVTLFWDAKVQESSGTVSTPMSGRLFLAAPVTIAE